MQQFQSLKRLLLFYALTLAIMLALYYAALYIGLKDNSERNSVATFNSLQHDITKHMSSLSFDIEDILQKPYLQDISYQLIYMLPSGQTYIYNYTRPNDKEITGVSFPSIPENAYQIDNDMLKATIELEGGYQVYVTLRHKVAEINWTSYRYWLPLMTAMILFIMAMLYIFRSQAKWQQLLLYTDNLSEDAKEAYSSIAFPLKKTTSEFLRLGHALSRIKYQLHNDYRRIKTLQYRLERLVDKAPLPMMMIKRQGQISFFNQRFEQVFATSYQRDMTYSLSDFLTGSDKVTQQLLLNPSNQRVTRTLLVYGLENNQPYQLHLTPWFSEHGQVRGFTAFLNNVNDFIKSSEDLRLKNQKLETKVNSFIELRSIIGHELRTPLNAIISTLDLVEKRTLDTEHQEILTTLTQSSQSMLAMLNDMLDMAKIEAGRVDIVSDSTDIYELGQHVSDLMLGHTRRQDIDLLYFFDPNTPRYIATDGSRLCQILLNLMDNAVKFTSLGYVALVVEEVTQQEITTLNLNYNSHKEPASRAISTNTEHSWIRFSVKDSGIGIASEDQQKLFSNFNQANPYINQKFGGTGLGLAISNSFAQLLGGFIHLDSASDVGSTFSLYIPNKSPIYHPVYHFHHNLLHIQLIAVVDQALRETYLQRIGDYLSLNISIYSDIDSAKVAQLEQQLTQQQPELTTILMLDYECYETYNATWQAQLETADREGLEDDKPIINPLKALIDNTYLPKILLSRKSERSIAATIFEKFDSFLNKPINVTLMLSELIRLAEHQSVDSRVNPSSTTFADTDNNKNYSLRNQKSTENETIETVGSNKKDSDSVETDSTLPLILVVEDNKVNQKITCKLLSKLGYRSMVAENGQQAINLLAQHRQQIGLILMDCRMPVMDGLAATEAIRNSGDDIAIIALTANDSAEDRLRCEQVGMDDYLTKPIQKNELQTTLQRFIS